MSKELPTFDVFTVKAPRNRSGKPYWTKIGGAWPNEKGGYNIELNAMPIEPQIILLPPREANEGS